MSAIQVPLYRLSILSNYRQEYDQDLVSGIAESYREDGFKPEYPISAYEDKTHPGYYIIIAGHTRFLAGLRYLGLTQDDTFMVWIVVNPEPTAAQFKLQQLHENSFRADPDDISKAIGYKQALDAGATMADLQHYTGKRESYILDRLAMLTLIPEAQDLVKHGHMGPKFAAQMTRLDSNFQRLALAWYTTAKSPTLPEFTEVISQYYTKQSQCSLLDLALFNGKPIEQITVELKIDRPKTRAELEAELEAEKKARQQDRLYAKDLYSKALRRIAELEAKQRTAV